MNEKDTAELDRIFNALANMHRRQIIFELGLQPASIKQLAARQKLSLPAIHRHIKVLEGAALVRRVKSGRTNFLALNQRQIKLLQVWLNQYHAYWGNGRETLENYVASIQEDELRLSIKKLSKEK